MASKMAQLRKRMWNRDPHCYWCGCKTIFIHRKGNKMVPPPEMNEATVEHYFSRYSPSRGKCPHIQRNVLACWKCNNERGRREQDSMPRDFLHKKSGSPPLAEISMADLIYKEKILTSDSAKASGRNPKLIKSLEIIQAEIQRRTCDEQ